MTIKTATKDNAKNDRPPGNQKKFGHQENAHRRGRIRQMNPATPKTEAPPSTKLKRQFSEILEPEKIWTTQNTKPSIS